jgi:hypothetical protein
VAKSKDNNGPADAGKVNKSAAVREAVAQNPQADSKAIMALLAEKGVRVSPTLVYYVRSKQGKEKRRQARHASDASRWTGTGNPLDLIVKVKALAAEAGGMDNLKRLVDVLAD